MRLVSLELSGFRGFSRHQEFDLDADAVIVVGTNGNGKTSLFDGILWALCGRIPRLCNEDSRLVSMYSEAGQARVSLRLKDPSDGREVLVTRSFDGKEKRVALQTPDGLYQGPAAEGKLIDIVWPEAASSSDPSGTLASVLARSVYLQQDLVRQFVEAASDQERFAAVSEIIGTAGISELQANLERSKRAWSTSTNQRQEELLPLRNRMAIIETRLLELRARASQAGPSMASDVWTRWWHSLEGIGLTAVQIEQESRDAPVAIDDAIKKLDAIRRSAERRLQALRILQADMSGLASKVIPDIQPLRNALVELRRKLVILKHDIEVEQTRLAELYRLQVLMVEKNEELKTLAALALRHLEDRCPVCAQAYDKHATRIRLETITKGGTQEVPTEPEHMRIPELLAEWAATEKETAEAELALRSAEQTVNEKQMSEQTLDTRLNELGIVLSGDADRNSAVAEAIQEATKSIRRLTEFQRIGESLALNLTRASALAAMDELQKEAETLKGRILQDERLIDSRNDTGDQAQGVIEALREAASTLVQERLVEIGPLLQDIYLRMDPHPAFRTVAFLSRVIRGKGELSTIISDPMEGKQCDAPAVVLSSSQVNALAIAVFLALNIGVPKQALSVAILDDPLQSLDDINLLGLMDLLRRVKDRHQLFVSTHDERFGSLLSRKLRPRDERGRTAVIELDGWSRSGPMVRMQEIKSDPVVMRLMHSLEK